MSVNNISSVSSQYIRQPSRTAFSEKANAIYAKLNEHEQSFLDKDTVEKALHAFTDVQSGVFSLGKAEPDSETNNNATLANQYDLASELAIRMQGTRSQIQQQPVLQLMVDDTGVLVSEKVKGNTGVEEPVKRTPNQTTNNYEQKIMADEQVQQHISITA